MIPIDFPVNGQRKGSISSLCDCYYVYSEELDDGWSKKGYHRTETRGRPSLEARKLPTESLILSDDVSRSFVGSVIAAGD